MKSIRISDSDSAVLRKFYEDELEKTQERLNHLRDVLAQLSGGGSGRRAGRPRKVRATAGRRRPGRPKGSVAKRGPGRPRGTGRKGRRGVSGKWNTLVMEMISKSPTFIQDIVAEGQKRNPGLKHVQVQQAINNTATALRKKGLVRTIATPGVRAKKLAKA